ncbi:MAG: alpha/beta hydrolase, partial [Chloroflexota bacterium]|nr:alpha/beta hydrolase [Chloroflexota bacterium]
CFVVSHGSATRTFVAHSGWIGTNEDWLPTLEVLSRSWRTVTYDHRGAGETVVPIKEITAEALLDDLFRVMDALDVERCVLGGFSAGSSTALRAVLARPERFEGLVLMNGSAGIRSPDTTPSASLPPPSQWPGATHSERMRWFIEGCTPEPDVEHIRRWGHHMLMRAEPEAAERLWGLRPASEEDLGSRLGELRVPTLLIHGEKDVFASTAAMEYVADQIPRSRLVVMEGSGHLPAMIRPEAVAAAINAYFPL